MINWPSLIRPINFLVAIGASALAQAMDAALPDSELVFLPGAGTALYRGLGAVVMFGILYSAMVTLLFLPSLLALVLGLRERWVAADGTPLGADFDVPSSGGGYPRVPRVAIHPADVLLTVWGALIVSLIH